MKYTGPVCRYCRREGQKLFLKGIRCESPKCPITKGRTYGPGQHGPTGRQGKPSEYKTQLREKQKARRIFNIAERQFENYYEAADRSKGITNEELLRKLEKRFDNIIYRAGFSSSRPEARQSIKHGFWKINGKAVSIPSYQVRVGDSIELNQTKAKKINAEQLKSKKVRVPGWIKADQKTLKGEILTEPGSDDFENNIASHLIVEFYSK